MNAKGSPMAENNSYGSQPPPAYGGSYAPNSGYSPVSQPLAPRPPPPPATPGPQYGSGTTYIIDPLYSRCAQGLHEPTTHFGVCGIITAIICFPIGLICLCIDTDRRCARCGIRM